MDFKKINLVTSVSSVTNAFNFAKGFREGFITNYYFTVEKLKKLISDGVFFEVYLGKAVFFLRENGNYFNLFYFAASDKELTRALPSLNSCVGDKTVIVDIVTKKELCLEKLVFEANHYSVYTSLVRMSSHSLNNLYYESASSSLRNAELKDLPELKRLLSKYFDPKAEQLPSTDDLKDWIQKSTVIVFEEQSCLIGFIIYDLFTSTLFLRYWFVHPSFRDRKIGSQLFNEFISRGKGTQRQLFWVIRSNENAIKRYIHYGFKEEKMYNYVLINKNISYER